MIQPGHVQSLVGMWQDLKDGEAMKSRELILLLLRQTESPFARSQFAPGHITATACVLHPSERAILLVHHRKLQRWLLPGGHVETDVDLTVGDGARREALEETGVVLRPEVPGRLVGLDVHGIPGRKKEPYHLHHDLIFRFQAESAEVQLSEEVRDVLWCPVGRFDEFDLPGPIRRAAARSFGP